jgi:hypothetical protein
MALLDRRTASLGATGQTDAARKPLPDPLWAPFSGPRSGIRVAEVWCDGNHEFPKKLRYFK